MSDKKLVFLLYYLALVISILAAESNSNSNYVSFPAQENGTCYKRVLYDDAIAANISKGIIKAAPNSQQGVKTNNNRGWITIIDCCEGYARNPQTNKCETHCENGCYGGTCTGPNVCTCDDGWRSENGVCKPICRRPCANNAYCFGPDVCTCKYGYEEIEGICKPVCLHDCPNGDCLAPRVCRCHPGYFLNETQSCEPVCEGGCAHGICSQPGVCSCDKGYQNSPNDQELCVPSCPDTCVNGECFSPNICTCKAGYTQDPASGTCNANCKNECVNGRCVSPDQCKCNPGFAMDWQAEKCVEGSQVLYGNRGVTRPQQSNQLQSVNDPSKRQQTNQTYAGMPYAKAHGTQGIVPNRNRATSNQQNLYGTTDQYEIYGTGQTQNPQGVAGVKGVNQPRANYGARDPYGNYDDEEEPEPQSYVPTQELNQTSGPRRTNNPYGAPRESNNPHEGPRDSNNPYGDYRNNETHRLQGSFPGQRPYSAQRPDSFHGSSQTPSPYDINKPYGGYGNNQTRQLHERIPGQRPIESQGPYPIPESYDRQELNQTQNPDRIYGPYGNNQAHKPRIPVPLQGPFPSQGPYPSHGVSQTQNPQEGNDPYGQPRVTTQYPVIIAVIPGVNQVQDPHRLNDPYGIHRNNQGYGTQGPYYPQGSVSSDTRMEQLQPGVKSTQRRPEVFPLYGRPGENQPGYLGVDLAYGVHELHPPQNNRPYANQGQNPSHEHSGTYDRNSHAGNAGTGSIYNQEPSLTHGIPQPYDRNNRPGNDGVIINYESLDGNIPGGSQYGSTCNPPCLNSDCVGPNVCMCKQGYEPDQRDRLNNKCLPICRGGCLNGVCSAPNLCLCNPGFIKEHGIKGAQRCVPAN